MRSDICGIELAHLFKAVLHSFAMEWRNTVAEQRQTVAVAFKPRLGTQPSKAALRSFATPWLHSPPIKHRRQVGQPVV